MEGFQIDELKLYMSQDIKIANNIILKCPKIRDIAEYGEMKYFSMAQTLCATPSSMKVQLDDMGLDFTKVSDFELFVMLSRTFEHEDTRLLLGDLDLSELRPFQLKDSDEIILANEDHTIIINEIIYDIMTQYIRKMHGFKKQVEKPGNEATRKILIDVERRDQKRGLQKPYQSFLRPVISAVKCRMCYPMSYIKDMGIFELMDDLSRLNIIVQADAALSGMYSGFCDTSKMDKTVLDWTRNADDDKKKDPQTILKEGAN